MLGIIGAMDEEVSKLKEAMELYTEGVKLADSCKKTLEGVEKEIKILSEDE